MELVNCARDLYTTGYTSPVLGNQHSVRLINKSMKWITPSRIPQYALEEKDSMKVNLHPGFSIQPKVNVMPIQI
jgi:ribulose-5-phosphate 4-epimerase/fuculose-1-phosphate aldolase